MANVVSVDYIETRKLDNEGNVQYNCFEVIVYDDYCRMPLDEFSSFEEMKENVNLDNILELIKEKEGDFEFLYFIKERGYFDFNGQMINIKEDGKI